METLNNMITEAEETAEFYARCSIRTRHIVPLATYWVNTFDWPEGFMLDLFVYSDATEIRIVQHDDELTTRDILKAKKVFRKMSESRIITRVFDEYARTWSWTPKEEDKKTLSVPAIGTVIPILILSLDTKCIIKQETYTKECTRWVTECEGD